MTETAKTRAAETLELYRQRHQDSATTETLQVDEQDRNTDDTTIVDGCENHIDGKAETALDRTSSGKFALGWSGGPGRPTRRTEEVYLEHLTARVTPEKWAKIVDVAIDGAVSGEPRAREWLGHYLIGKPVERVIMESRNTLLAAVLDGLRQTDTDDDKTIDVGVETRG